jgi:hypothetical protein
MAKVLSQRSAMAGYPSYGLVCAFYSWRLSPIDMHTSRFPPGINLPPVCSTE